MAYQHQVISPERALDSLQPRFGRHPHARALHAKGLFVSGSFTATPEAAKLTCAAHMQGDPVAVSARLSNGSGDPGAPDYEPDVRGLAVKFELPGGSSTDILAQTSPIFPVRTPEAMIEMVIAAAPSPSALVRVPLFMLRRRVGPRALALMTSGLRPPQSYATCSYHAIHAFRWIDASGSERFLRYRWLPVAGVASISLVAARRRGRDYLQQEIAERLGREPVRFALELQLAGPGDAVDDPATLWPADRERVTAGTLELTALDPDRERDGSVVVFDPTRLTDGIERSGDALLAYRPGAYSVSAERRSG